MAGAVLKVVLENLSSLVQKELGLLLGVNQEMKRLSNTLTTIQAVVEDAEEKQFTNRAIKIWLQRLKDAAHVLNHILDECATEAIRLEYQGMLSGLANKGKRPFLSFFSPKHVFFRHKIANKMKNISKKLDEIAEERRKFHLCETVIAERRTEVMGWRQTTSIITEPQVYGREDEKNKIVDYLVGLAINSESLSVYPIVGMGGLGKTTLAQLIFNDERVINHFELRIWVCVSDDLDLKRISKGIIESATGLSYLYLSIKARQCFAFCAIFPKDHETSKHLLIELWMANGFISSNQNGKLEVEDIGDEVWNELCWRSFFQDIKTDEFGKISFKMHDLLHDLAQSVADEVCRIDDNNGLTNLSERTHHLSIYTYNSPNQCDLLHLPQIKSLKTCIMQENYGVLCFHNLLKCYSLRVLQCQYLNELSSSIGHLKHLRYLNLSFGSFKILPESICSLWNLQILNLNYCNNLQRLPNNLSCLRALRHLHLRNCYSLSSLTYRIGQLTFLKTLNVYLVGKKKGFLLAELEHLNLRGELHIKHLENVKSVMDANEANMVNKNLDDLKLSWGENGESGLQENVEQILDALKPHKQLKSLVVEGCRGVHFPKWMGSATLKYLSNVELSSCTNCMQLPTLGKLPCLKKLRLSNMNHVLCVDEDTYIGGAATGFRALEYLSLVWLPNLERLSKEDGENIYPCLSHMDISHCPKLGLPRLPSISKLDIQWRCSEALVGSIHTLHNLKCLCFWYDEELASFPDGMLRSLTSLKELCIVAYNKLKVLPIEATSHNALENLCIRSCNNLELITEQTLQGLHSLKRLEISKCHKLKLFGGFQYLTSLQHLTLIDCPEEVEGLLSEALQHLRALQSLYLQGLPNLASLPDCFQNLSNLRSLYIYVCPKLMSLPISIQGLCNLDKLEIFGCPELTKRCEKEIGDDWHKIAHIHSVLTD